MRIMILTLLIILGGCNNKEPKSGSPKVDNLETTTEEKQQPLSKTTTPVIPIPDTYANERFKNVTVESIDDSKFRIRGLAQIFEATFNWIVEDGHEELLKGFQMTDAGAPEWVKFEFTISVQKKRENSTLTLYLFELSAKDGSRQYELPIVLK